MFKLSYKIKFWAYYAKNKKR